MNKKLPLSYLEISKGNLLHNIKQFRSFIKKDTKLAAVIKANAYGHGDKEIIKIIAPYVDYFQINSVEELARARTVIAKPILLLGYVSKTDMATCIKLGCIITAFDFQHLMIINESARKLGKKQKVHIAVDAHLGREGILIDQVSEFLTEAKKMNNIVIDGVYAHFANIEDTNDFSHAKKQIETYKNILKIFSEYGYDKIHTHISATSGIFEYEKEHGYNSIVRLGIGMYGMWPSVDIQKKWKNKINLKPILRWVTHIAQIKDLPKDHSIGYGLTYITKKPMTVAVIPQGYSNGFPRLLSNKGEVLICGKRAPVLGRVAMNMMVVDVSDIKEALPESEVVILGSQKNDQITAEELAFKIATINYEVTTCISALLPKVIVK